MTRGVEILLNGVSLGLLYALIALGFVIVFKATRTVNFAHASFVLFGVWVVAQTSAILGGLGSVGGAVAGAVFVVTLPLLFSRYADSLPFVTGAGGQGLDASTAAQFVYGAVVIVAVIVQPGGLAALAGSVRPLRSRRPAAAATP
ncbi:hypothetical protein SALBM311S_06754 [Streptomyces alboniger]